MTQPTAFERLVDYTDDATNNVSGRDAVRPDKLDAEMDALATTVAQILTNLALIQRDDTNIKDGVVKLFTLATDVKAMLATAGVNVRGSWVTSTAYAVNDLVQQSNNTYICAVAHTSGTFSTDLAAVKWLRIAESAGAIGASSVTNTPAGTIAATDVQAAIDELDSEKLAKASNLSDLANVATARANLAVLALAGGTLTGDLVLADAVPDTSLSAVPKSYADDVINGLGAGQCYLTFVSTTSVRLDPSAGNRIFINGEWPTIPSSGVTLSNSGLSANTVYNVYAYLNAGAISLEASTTARSTDTTYGHQIKNGDATRTLVGKIRTNGSTQFYDSWADGVGVISWFNRRTKQCGAQSPNSGSFSRSAASYAQVTPQSTLNVLSWGEVLDISGVCSAFGTAGAAYFSSIPFIDGTATGLQGAGNPPAINQYACTACMGVGSLSEGNHTVGIAIAANGTNSVTVSTNGASIQITMEG